MTPQLLKSDKNYWRYIHQHKKKISFSREADFGHFWGDQFSWKSHTVYVSSIRKYYEALMKQYGYQTEVETRGGMTLSDYGYLPQEFLPCFRVKFSKYTPCLGVWLSSRNFFQGGRAKSIVMQISSVMLIFLLFLNLILRGGGKSLRGANCLRGKPGVSREQCIKMQKGVVLSTCSASLQIRSMTFLPNFYPGSWLQNNFVYVL